MVRCMWISTWTTLVTRASFAAANARQALLHVSAADDDFGDGEQLPRLPMQLLPRKAVVLRAMAMAMRQLALCFAGAQSPAKRLRVCSFGAAAAAAALGIEQAAAARAVMERMTRMMTKILIMNGCTAAVAQVRGWKAARRLAKAHRRRRRRRLRYRRRHHLACVRRVIQRWDPRLVMTLVLEPAAAAARVDCAAVLVDLLTSFHAASDVS